MKHKSYLLMVVLLMLTIIMSACGNDSGSKESTADSQETPVAEQTAGELSQTITYQSESGPVEIPAKPVRIVALTNAPNVLSLGETLVGVDQWTAANPLFTDKLKGVAIVSEEDPESVAAQNPDLIIAGSHMKNLDQFANIAPTVSFTWGKLDYLNQQLEIGKLVNKEAEAQQWIDDFKQRTAAIGKEIKAKHGENITVSAIEISDKSVFVMGNNWARGTEILYQAMNLAMPEKVKQDTQESGSYSLSLEVLPEYSGDFLVVSRNMNTDNEIMKSNIWNSIPAVQNKRVIEFETKASTYSDPTTLEYLLDIFQEGFLGQP
ncbi:ABC transporter substrate-binding protein [Paenibacillus albidus]|uniref:ABC transporter substrate-binding protein n=1 Tax=Paenibacillus albidus TaxID=2041023 RepID=A0A917CLE2_9BACL|nr:ABC transporter substrate-binding protein [Paenibacillus albidus]GGF91598.1 ABC transporter substrate-binding protein [Paenibacillus albidus]